MINPKNSLILAGTKLKTRKLRLFFTVLISSLLFGVLTAVVLLFTGLSTSTEKFSRTGINDRFFVSFNPSYFGNKGYDMFNSEESRQRAKAIANELADKMANRAKELRINELTRKQIFEQLYPSDLDKEFEFYKLDNKVQKILMQEVLAKSTDKDRELSETNVDKLLEGVNYIHKFSFENRGVRGGILIAPNKDGKYILSSERDGVITPTTKDFDTGEEKPLIQTTTLVPEHIAKAYRFKDSQWTKESGTVPIIVSNSIASNLLGIKIRMGSGSDQDILKRYEELQQKAIGFKIRHCFYNNLAQNQLQQALQHERQKNDKDYIKPELVYGLPENGACQIATILSDTRSSEVKRLEKAQHQMNVEFNGAEAEPIAKEIVFEIVGLLPSLGYLSGSFADSIIINALGTPNIEIASSIDDFQAISDSLGIGNIYSSSNSDDHIGFYGEALGGRSWFAEFASADKARAFIDAKTCRYDLSPDGDVMLENGVEPSSNEPECPVEKPFFIYGALNNQIYLAKAIKGFMKGLLIALAVVVVIATIIMGATVGRMIADSRRETAVFRAIGFRRFDITSVYGAYSFIVCLLIVAMSFGLGFLGASIVASAWNGPLTTRALIATNASDLSLKFSLLGISIEYLALLLGAIMLVGLLSVAMPMIRNLRRDLIKDMRDE